MTKLIALVGLVLLVAGCSGAYEPAVGDTGGNAGAAGGTTYEVAPEEPEGERYCHTMLDYQDAGGFWCETQAGEFVETDDENQCRWCYLVVCADDGIEWFPTECAGMGSR